jgi:hypothetical protein
VVNATLGQLYPREIPGTHCTGGWVGLDGCGKFRPLRDSIPGPSSPYRVAILTALSHPTRHSSTICLTSALDGVGGQRHALAALPPGKTGYPFYRRLGGAHSQSAWVRKISTLNGIRSPDRPALSGSLYRLSYSGLEPRGVE